VNGFLRDVFQPSRYEEHPLVRDVYFTSGTQTGGAPIDRVMGALAANLGLDDRPRQPPPAVVRVSSSIACSAT